MTPFSTVLESLMKEKNIKTYAIAQYCGIDRSNMYKVLKGKRNPASEEVVNRMAEYMQLTPVEQKRLLEAYQITVVGAATYYRRKSVKNFLTSFSLEECNMRESALEQEYMTVSVDEQIFRGDGTLVRGRQLKYLISSVLNVEMQKGDGKISLIMQPDNDYVMDILFLAGVKKDYLKMEHIFCLSNANEVSSEKKDYNLECLRKILPMFVQCKCSYKPYCYYDNIASHRNRFNLLSSLIITSDYAVAFSAEENYGVLLTGENTIQYLQTLFENLKQDTVLMACKMDTLEGQIERFASVNINSGGVGFQADACLVPLLPPEFLGHFLKEALLSQPVVREKSEEYLSFSGEMMAKTNSTFLFSQAGIERFLRDGRLSELPESIYYPLDYKARLLLLGKLMKECESGKYRMLREEVPVAETDICLFSSPTDGYLLVPTTRGDRIFLEIRESGLLNAFLDYFKSLDDKSIYSEEETVAILKQILKRNKG